jgi:hypothetical protein
LPSIRRVIHSARPSADAHRGDLYSEVVLSCSLVQEPGGTVEPGWSEPPGYRGEDSTCVCLPVGGDLSVRDGA